MIRPHKIKCENKDVGFLFAFTYSYSFVLPVRGAGCRACMALTWQAEDNFQELSLTVPL